MRFDATIPEQRLGPEGRVWLNGEDVTDETTVVDVTPTGWGWCVRLRKDADGKFIMCDGEFVRYRTYGRVRVEHWDERRQG